MTPLQRSAFLELGKVIATTNGANPGQKGQMPNQRSIRKNGSAGHPGAS